MSSSSSSSFIVSIIIIISISVVMLCLLSCYVYHYYDYGYDYYHYYHVYDCRMTFEAPPEPFIQQQKHTKQTTHPQRNSRKTAVCLLSPRKSGVMALFLPLTTSDCSTYY